MTTLVDASDFHLLERALPAAAEPTPEDIITVKIDEECWAQPKELFDDELQEAFKVECRKGALLRCNCRSSKFFNKRIRILDVTRVYNNIDGHGGTLTVEHDARTWKRGDLLLVSVDGAARLLDLADPRSDPLLCAVFRKLCEGDRATFRASSGEMQSLSILSVCVRKDLGVLDGGDQHTWLVLTPSAEQSEHIEQMACLGARIVAYDLRNGTELRWRVGDGTLRFADSDLLEFCSHCFQQAWRARIFLSSEVPVLDKDCYADVQVLSVGPAMQMSAEELYEQGLRLEAESHPLLAHLFWQELHNCHGQTSEFYQLHFLEEHRRKRKNSPTLSAEQLMRGRLSSEETADRWKALIDASASSEDSALTAFWASAWGSYKKDMLRR